VWTSDVKVAHRMARDIYAGVRFIYIIAFACGKMMGWCLSNVVYYPRFLELLPIVKWYRFEDNCLNNNLAPPYPTSFPICFSLSLVFVFFIIM
jgi:hypothetical protein